MLSSPRPCRTRGCPARRPAGPRSGRRPADGHPVVHDGAMTTLTGQQVADEGLTGWAYLLGRLQTRIATPDFAAGLALVAAIGAAAGPAGPHPDVDLRRTHVDVRLT